jgi:hypothetical protein
LKPIVVRPGLTAAAGENPCRLAATN